MTCTWLVQRPPPGDDSPTCRLLEAACSALELPFISLDVTPGISPALPVVEGPVVVHGRATLLRTALADPRWRSGVFDAPAFAPSAYLRGWGARMLNPDIEVRTWGEALSALERHGRLFVRPDDDDKLFTGQVFDATSFRELFERASSAGKLTAHTRVVTCGEREIDLETRLFIVEGALIGGSTFRPSASPKFPSELVAFALEAIDAWRPHEVFVLDVARSGGAYRIVEANCFNGSRFYASDVISIVRAVSGFARGCGAQPFFFTGGCTSSRT